MGCRKACDTMNNRTLWLMMMALLTTSTFGQAALMDDAVNAVGTDLADDDPYHCDDSDQTGGLGGQSVSCSDWECKAHSDVNLYVDADDPDAVVSGEGDCGNGHLQCSGSGATTDNCSDGDFTTTAGSGSCSGDSDEAYDSGLYVECSASYVGDPDPPCGTNCVQPPPEYWCPLVIEPHPPYPAVCLDRFEMENPCRKIAAVDNGNKPCEVHIQACEIWNAVGSFDVKRFQIDCESAPGILGTLISVNALKSSRTLIAYDGVAASMTCSGWDCVIQPAQILAQADGVGFRLE